MAINHFGHAAAVLSLAACLCAASAFGADGAHPASAEEAIAGALANVKSRYRAKLDRYGLTESYFDETSGICDLMLLDIQSWTKYQIAYYRATDEISWPRIMPKGVAKDLMQDRLLIQKYELVLGKGKTKAKGEDTSTATPKKSTVVPKKAVKTERRKQTEYKPLNEEYVPTEEETKAIAECDKRSRQLAKEQQAAKGKRSLNQTATFRQMEELKRSGMSGDEIASRFGIDQVKEYNKAHPGKPIKTSKHSKPGAPGFSW